MPVSTGAQAVANANAYHTCRVGMCLAYVHDWLEIGSLYPSAYNAWLNTHYKHPGDRTPPKGAPVFWRGGSQGYGHIALAVGGTKIRSTDVPGAGRVSTIDLSYIERYWGQTYLGWTEDLNGIMLPYLHTVRPSRWSTGDVYVEKLKLGVTDSDSVRRLRYRLEHHQQVPAKYKPGLGGGYGARTEMAVQYFQRSITKVPGGPKDGSYLSNPQANALFGPAYRVIEA